MTASLADIHRYLIESYNDEELTTLCFYHFLDVYRNFADGMSLNRKAMQLVDYCQRRERIPELLAILLRERPETARRVFGRISKSAERRVNINTAEVEELRSLPGIGPALASAIVAGRPFASVDELARVPLIGPRRLTALREWCTV